MGKAGGAKEKKDAKRAIKNKCAPRVPPRATGRKPMALSGSGRLVSRTARRRMRRVGRILPT